MKYLIIFTFFLSVFSYAADSKNPCFSDIEKFCKTVKKGQGRVVKCLAEHSSELTPACKTKMDEVKTKVKTKAAGIKDKCKDDFMKFCKDIKKGSGKLLECLKSHNDQLSTDCKDALSRKKAPLFKK